MKEQGNSQDFPGTGPQHTPASGPATECAGAADPGAFQGAVYGRIGPLLIQQPGLQAGSFPQQQGNTLGRSILKKGIVKHMQIHHAASRLS